MVLTYYGIPLEFRDDDVHLFIKTAIRHRVSPPEFIGSHAIAYRWRSLPRVRRDKPSKPHQGSSERVLTWQVIIDQLMYVPLSHTHYWYEVGMLKVPANIEKRLNDGPRGNNENEAKQNKLSPRERQYCIICKPKKKIKTGNARNVQVRATCG